MVFPRAHSFDQGQRMVEQRANTSQTQNFLLAGQSSAPMEKLGAQGQIAGMGRRAGSMAQLSKKDNVPARRSDAGPAARKIRANYLRNPGSSSSAGLNYRPPGAGNDPRLGPSTHAPTEAVGGEPGGNVRPKIVFLDVDGVLHSVRVQRQEQLFHPQKMAMLRKILAQTKAQIVLSSAWRRTTPTLRMACQMLRQHGMKEPIGLTPDYGLCGKRSAEILTWVQRYGITSWVAIDDLDLQMGEPRMRGHFIKCNPLEGLNEHLVDMAINILGAA